jgi:hypothetical protein
MNSPNALLLGLTLPRSVPTLRRSAELCSIDFPYKFKGQTFIHKYWFIRYGKALPLKEFDRGVIPELLELCPPNLPSYTDKPQSIISEGMRTEKKQLIEGQAEVPELDKIKLISFLDKWGVIGLNDPLRGSIGRQMFESDLSLWFRIGLKHSKRIYKDKEALKVLTGHQFEIVKGNELPLYIIEQHLRQLARFLRLTLALKETKESKGTRYAKRVVTAWDQVIPVPDFGKDSDPASPKYDKRKVWTWKDKDGLTLLSPENISRVFDDFALRVNHYLQPLSQMVLTTEKIKSLKERGFGLEVSFTAYLVNALKDENKIVKRCVICQLPYIPTRNKTDGLYCPRCSNAESQRNYRKRKKLK